jgi:protein phosphatase
MKLEISAVSDKGCVREHNEDMVLIGDDIFRDDRRHLVVDLEGENHKFFVAVADGIGGHSAGEVASEIVLRNIAEKIDNLKINLTKEELSNRMSEWTKEIHLCILNEGNKDVKRKGMGTTLIGLLFYNGNLYYVNVGDSRVYRFRGGMLMQISKDHSLRELTNNPNIPSNIIVNSFGGGEKVFSDFEIASKKIIEGDIYLLCSDGLSDMVSEEKIEKILSEEDSEPIEKLLNKAKENGGDDNISIVLIQITETAPNEN